MEQLSPPLHGEGVETCVSHCSVSRDERRRAQGACAVGNDRVIVATCTLELGLEVGDQDRVFRIDAPVTVASFLPAHGA